MRQQKIARSFEAAADAGGRTRPSGRQTAHPEKGPDRSPRMLHQQRLSRAIDGSPRMHLQRRRLPQAFGTVAQRVGTIVIGGTQSSDSELIARVRDRAPGFEGDIWFNNEAEAQAYAGGTAEGMGVWNGEWINMASRRTVVFGEEHNEIREDFVSALNIRHRLVEGAAERTLRGVPIANIPGPPPTHAAHRPYRGDEQGKALENFWLRSAQYMARFAAPTLLRLSALVDAAGSVRSHGTLPDDVWVPALERSLELLEIIRTLKGVTIPALRPELPPMERNIIAALDAARHYAISCVDFGVEEFATMSEAAGTRGGYRAYRAFIEELQRNERLAHLLYRSFRLFAEAVETLGTLQFHATASSGEAIEDQGRVAAAEALHRGGHELTGFEVWGPRRETAMLANIREALGQAPAPILVTMGAAHARNRYDAIATLVGANNVVIGDITALAAFGKSNR